MSKRWFFLSFVFCSLFWFNHSTAQNNFNNIIFKIDSLAEMGLPKSAIVEVAKLESLARRENATSQIIRATLYRLNFQTYLEDDALISVINSLKQDIDNSSYPVKPILQSFLADMYWSYYQSNRYRFAGRSKLEKADVDFRNWDLSTIVEETSRLYKLSLSEPLKEQDTKLDILDGVLTGNANTRILRPTLYDLLLHKALDYFLSDEPGLIKPKMPFSLNDSRFFAESSIFANTPVITTDTNSTYYHGIKLLQQATAFHIKGKSKLPLADLDLKRLSFIYENATIKNKDSLYVSALKNIAADTAAGIIRADALVAIGKYEMDQDSLVRALPYLKEAIEKYPKTNGAKNSSNLIKTINQKALSAEVEDVNMPGKSILAFLNYRNIKSANYILYTLTEAQTAYLSKIEEYSERIMPGKATFEYLKKLKPVQQRQLSLPQTHDYAEHSTEFKIESLKSGIYVLVLKQGLKNDSLLQLVPFKVSGLAYTLRTRPDGRREVRVFNRETGDMLKGVNVVLTAESYTSAGGTKHTRLSGITDAWGSFIGTLSGNRISVSLTKGTDHLINKDEYLYYTPTTWVDEQSITRTILFTDRQVYRPGQTIYFKGLHLKVLDGKSNILPNTDLTVTFKGQNAQQLGTLTLHTNDFGTVAGAFTIPQTILNGTLSISTGTGSIRVGVEEYKRPTFKLGFDAVSKSFRLNDSVAIKGTVTAFSGYGVSNVRVAYHITRAANANDISDKAYYESGKRAGYDPDTEILNDTLTTDAQGKFEVKFLASPKWDGSPIKAYTFTVTADATDGNNETRSAVTALSLSNRAVYLNVDISQKITIPADARATIQINNSAQQPQQGSAVVSIYALKNPGIFFKERLWAVPDKPMITPADFKSDFPRFAYAHEDGYKNWARGEKIAVLNITVNKTIENKIELDKLIASAPGVYEVFVEARNEAGDTVSAKHYINFITEAAPVQKNEDWVVPLSTSVKPGTPAVFFVGLGKACTVLMETYSGDKLLSSKPITLSAGGLNKIVVDVPKTPRNSFSVQFTTINDNRRYDFYQRIIVADTISPLRIQMASFRDKLTPGQKEQWTLKISGSNDAQAAELLASMYDASLDEIRPSDTWQSIINGPPHQQAYFQWENIAASSSVNTIMDERYTDDFGRDAEPRNYEELYKFGFDYDGQYNSNFNERLENADLLRRVQLSEKKKEALYRKNAAMVKNGFDVVGRVLNALTDSPLSGIIVKISTLYVSTITNPLGYFKIKVPAKSALIFSGKGWGTRKIKPANGQRLIVSLLSSIAMKNGMSLSELKSADPGQKSMMGDPNAEIRIDEPVGNNDIKMVTTDYVVATNQSRAEASNGYGYSAVRFPPPLLKEDSVQFGAPSIAVPRNNSVTLRKNFDETAFFFPQLRTDDKGSISISFTAPESLTKWKFRSFAHTKNMQTGYIEQSVTVSKPFMISANMPRFLREGDTLTVAARVVNLTDSAFSGNARLELLNAATLQPLPLHEEQSVGKPFRLERSSTGAVSFQFIVPAGIDALTYRVSAVAGLFTDGEENTLPVLPNSIAVDETMPFMVRAGETKEVQFDRFINQKSNTLVNKTLTLDYSQNPVWTVVQALPYLMEYPYECSEQIFSRYYANSFAAAIVNSQPKVKQVFAQWKSADSKELLSNLDKNPELRSILKEETPWLADALSEQERKNRIAILFDLDKVSASLGNDLAKLQKKQLSNGSFPWFGGNNADQYITQHVLAGIGQVNNIDVKNKNNAILKQISNRAIKYLDAQLKVADLNERKVNKLYQTRNLSPLEIHAWYARSYFNTTVDKDLADVKKVYLNRALQQWASRTPFEKAMIGITLNHWGDRESTSAIIRSLLENARRSDDMGMYWADNQPGYYWDQSPIEAQSAIIELFVEAANRPADVNEMKTWLLRNKQIKNWGNTKATAAACYALLAKGGYELTDAPKTSILINNEPLEKLKPKLKQEEGIQNINTSWTGQEIKTSLGQIKIINPGKSIGWGAMFWQYTEKPDKVTASNTQVEIERKYYIQKQTDAGPRLTAVSAGNLPTTGDVLKVVINIKAGRDFDYIHLKDMRPAGTEPIGTLSEPQYRDGLYYYKEIKDAATNFFINRLDKGNYVFEYSLRVVQPGNYSTGITSLESMYAPEFSAHTAGQRLIFTANK